MSLQPYRINGENMERREFLKKLSAGLLIISGEMLQARTADKQTSEASKTSEVWSKIVICNYSKATDINWKVNAESVRIMLDESIMELIDEKEPRDAWVKLFPNISSKDVIGIKVNCLNRFLPTHIQVVDAIVLSLRNIGVDENRIIIWDRKSNALNKAGYTINTSSTGAKCFGTDAPGIGYDDDKKVSVIGRKLKLSRILTELCTYLINVPVLKEHNVSGITLAMKNHYGSIPLSDNIPLSLPDIRAMHANNGNPQIAQLNANPLIKEKTKLIVCDALLGIFNGGPDGSPQWANNQLIVSADPVATDYHGMLIIDGMRKEKGLSSIIQKAQYINTAANLGLGANNPQEMDTRMLELG